ncbi:30S ribosomal protein S9 [Patescibacteria group bacterium]|nr:30S ribosomal protein S9 [Patescibacteria group bacterium]
MEKKPLVEKKPTVRRVAAKKPVAKVVVTDETKETVVATKAVAATNGDFVKAIGRRKEASARVKLFPSGKGLLTVNGRESNAYFPVFELQESIQSPLKLSGRIGKVDVEAFVRGGGIHGQAEAVRLGIARALVVLDQDLRTSLKKSGLLKRDPRVKERKKYGLKKARRAPQWAKR